MSGGEGDVGGVGDGRVGVGSGGDGFVDIRLARQFRKHHVLPRRREEEFVNPQTGEKTIRIRRTEPGASVEGTKTYHECDITLANLSEFGIGV